MTVSFRTQPKSSVSFVLRAHELDGLLSQFWKAEVCCAADGGLRSLQMSGGNAYSWPSSYSATSRALVPVPIKT